MAMSMTHNHEHLSEVQLKIITCYLRFIKTIFVYIIETLLFAFETSTFCILFENMTF